MTFSQVVEQYPAIRTILYRYAAENNQSPDRVDDLLLSIWGAKDFNTQNASGFCEKVREHVF